MSQDIKDNDRQSNEEDTRVVQPVCFTPVPGGRCPVCGKGKLEYNGLLFLQCDECGYQAPGGGFT